MGLLTATVYNRAYDGGPKRLLYKPATHTERKAAMTVAGARMQDNGDVSYHAEPLVLADLQMTLGHDTVQVDELVALWNRKFLSDARTSLRIQGLSDAGNWSLNHMGEASLAGIARSNPKFRDLYPFQRTGAAWLSFYERGILGDAPGLGKTPQAIIAATSARSHLIVTLAAVVDHWRKHLAEWAPDRDVGFAIGTHEQRQRVIDEGHDWLVVNHEMLRPEGPTSFRGLLAPEGRRLWDCMTIDEAHKFQGRPPRKEGEHGSQQSLGAAKIHAHALHMLTGTPVWNKPESIWHLLRLLDPYRWSSYWQFVEEYCITVPMEWGTDVIGMKPDELDRFRSIMAPQLLQRQKRDVAPWLPEKIYEEVEWTPTPDQRKAYRTLKKEWRREDRFGTVQETYSTFPLAALRNVLNMPMENGLGKFDPKYNALLDILAEMSGGNRKIIIFCWHRDYVEYLAARLEHTGYTVQYAHGGMSIKERNLSADLFRSREDVNIFVGTIGAMGTGIEFVEATAAIFAEASHVPTLNRQAEDRLHRIVTKVSPVICRLYAPRTVESAVWQVSDERGDEADEMLATREIVTRVLSEGD